MKSIIFSVALMLGSTTLVSTASAQSNQELCTQFDSHGLGVYKGSLGEVAGQADKRIKKCLKYGVTLDKDEYLRGLAEGQKSFCTAARGKEDVANNQSPARACRMTDNPYMWEFRGQPLVNMPTAGAASFAKAKQDIPLDLDYIKGVYNRADPSTGTTPNARIVLLGMRDIFDQRIEMLKKERSGLPLLPAAVNSPGPKYRKGMSGEDIIGGLFKASNWKSGDDLTPMRIRKKNCKAGKWSKYGEQHGRFGADITAEIAEATKKCAKHDVVFNEAEYRSGFQKSLVDYCGYERGFFTSLNGGDGNDNCTTGMFPNYTKGYKHGEVRRTFTGLASDIPSTRNFYKRLVKVYNSGGDSTGELSLVDLNGIFGRRKNLQRFIANERARLNQLEADVQAHKLKYPELYEDQGFGVEPRPDSELDYPIPH